MKSLCKISIISILILCIFAYSAFAKAVAGQEDVKVAKVGNIYISQEDVTRYAQKIMPMQLGFHGNVDEERIAEIRKEALEGLITRAYKVQYAIEEEIVADSAAFEKEWQARIDKNKQAFDRATPAQLSNARAYLYLDFLASESEKVAVLEKVKVSPRDVENHYKQNKEKFFRPKLYTASHVFVRVGPSESAEVKNEKKERAESLYQRANAGEDFYNLAYYESDDRSKYVGGSLGSFHAGQTVAEFDTAIQSMKVGEVSEPVRTIYGYHIIKLDALEEERQMEFAEVSETIHSSLKDSMEKKLREDWLNTLREKYTVEYLSK